LSTIEHNECKKHLKSDLGTVTLGVDLSKRNKLKFLIDTGAEISIVSGSSLKPGIDCSLGNGINIRGISDTILKTGGMVKLKVSTGPHETTHTFHAIEGNLQWQYDGILGRDVWGDKGAGISYCDRDYCGRCNNRIRPQDGRQEQAQQNYIKARSEILVKVPTASKGQGLISNKEHPVYIWQNP
jgi:hypothetical protein